MLNLSAVCDGRTGRCYWVGGAANGWTNSRRLCQDQGGDLAVMETRELWQFVAENAATLRYNLSPQSVSKNYFAEKLNEPDHSLKKLVDENDQLWC